MRITLITETFFPQINGVSRTLDRLTRYLASQGDQVQLIAPAYSESEREASPLADRTALRAFPLPFYREVLCVPVRPATVARALRSFGPQVVHIATEGPLGWAGLVACRRLGLPRVSSYHTNFAQYARAYRLRWLTPLIWRYLRWFHNHTERTFCPTPSIRAILEDQGFRNVDIWARGVDADRFSPHHRDEALRQEYGFAPETVVLVHSGRLAAEKNIQTLFEAFARLPESLPVALLNVGDGPLKAQLEQTADRRIRFAGYRHGDDLARHYASGDVLVCPSLTETFGNVIQEGMASGLPAVGFDAPGPRDIIAPGETGLVVSPIDAPALAEAIARLASDRDGLRAMGRQARAYAETRNWDQINAVVRQGYEAAWAGAAADGSAR